MAKPQLILGSGSPQRNKLMQAAGYDFKVIVPDESAECGVCSTGGPAALVGDLAVRKAANVVEKLTANNADMQPLLIIACDTLAECNGAVLGKPKDEDHARAMLTQLSGRVHRVYSGLCLWPLHMEADQRPIDTRIAMSELKMDSLETEELEQYLASGLWRGKAGAFGLQDRPGWLQLVSGSESNVIGMPMELLEEMLSSWETSSD